MVIMNKYFLETAIFIVMVSALTGCASPNKALLANLNSTAQSVCTLEREQQAMISSKAAPTDVYSKVLQADSYLKYILDICKKQDKSDKELLSSCMFYQEVSFKFSTNMMLNASKYYLKNGDEVKAGQVLRDLVDKYSGEAQQTEIDQAKLLLEKLKSWTDISPGMKAYLIGDYAIAVQKFMSKGDPESLYYVGQLYYIGSGVTRDLKLAFEWFVKSAEKGYAPAQYRLGLLYLYGEGVELDAAEAVIWLQKAAEQNYPPAEEMLKSIKTK
jgi:TPR repeat protein